MTELNSCTLWIRSRPILIGLTLLCLGSHRLTSADSESIESLSHSDYIEFINGDQLWGSLVSFDRDKGILWRRNDSPNTINIDAKDVLSLRPHTQIEPDTDTNSWRLSFTNGDSVSGQILEFNEEIIRMGTPYAGVFSAPRMYVRAMIALFQETIYAGPNQIEGWTLGNVSLPEGDGGVWRYDSSAFFADAAASIARDVDLPGMCSVKMDLMWKGRLNIALALYTDFLQPITLADKDNEPSFGGFYSLQINDRSSAVIVINQVEPIRRLGYAFTPELAHRNSAEFEIFVNKSEASFSLAIDGKLAHTWVDNRGFLGEGDGIRIVHQGDGQVRLSGLQVRTWNGALPEDDIPASDAEADLLHVADGAVIDRGADPSNPDSRSRLRRVNGVPLRGKVTKIEDNQVQFKETNRELIEIPSAKTQSILFSDAGLKLLVSEPGIERVELISGENFLLRAQRIDETGLYGEHPVLGPLTIKREAIKQIRFGQLEE